MIADLEVSSGEVCAVLVERPERNARSAFCRHPLPVLSNPDVDLDALLAPTSPTIAAPLSG
ncbi:MAG TPA: hypothetical protein VGI79_08200 [Caulobacteraceae bacterium]|jgi:hypothetical protein